MDINVMACLNGHVNPDDKDWRCIHIEIDASQEKNEDRFRCALGNNVVIDSQALSTCLNKETE